LIALDCFTKWLQPYTIPNQEVLVWQKCWLPTTSATSEYCGSNIVTRAITLSPAK
jgi:hypothetical protein